MTERGTQGESARRLVELPSGRRAALRPAKVRDLLQAHRVTGFSNEPMAIALALAAEVALLDERPVVYEELLELPAEDGLVLQAEVIGEEAENFPPAQGRANPDFSAPGQ
ncbi:MAG TPA: hypothetical protein VFB15_06890 [Candidatus Binataceae bacterium]|jgi:hypothetical protein|nr:hypothetical protein [Candidatus Binataceae bacterium]